MTTLTLTLAIGLICLVAVLLYDRAVQISRRRDRETVRRIIRYLDQCPPRSPW